MRAVISSAVLTSILLTGCALSPYDNRPDIEDPKAGDQFIPAVGYMPECDDAYRRFDGALYTSGNGLVLRNTCALTVSLLGKLPGLTFKYPLSIDEATRKEWRKWGARPVARSGGSWIDHDLEKKVGAKYRILFGNPDIAPESANIEIRYTVQRISDGKIMRVQPRGGASRYAGESAKTFADQIQRVLNDPASVPPQWHSPF